MSSNQIFVPQLQEITKDKNNETFKASMGDFEELLTQVDNAHIKEDSVVKGQVIDVDKKVVVVDVGLKNEGRIPIAEFMSSEKFSLPEVGDFVDVFVEKIDGRKGTLLSRSKAIKQAAWFDLEEIFKKSENIEGVIYERIKGGFNVNIQGVTAFLPGSQVDIRPVQDISAIMDIPQIFRILQMDDKIGNIVVSRKLILEESRSEERDAALAKISVGSELEGTVKNITPYGAFIDLGQIDGLLHLTDISWRRISHPSEILSLGQQVKVVVILYDEEKKRISLGMKQLTPGPWENILEEFPKDKVMKGKITNITDYGAFVQLKEGVEGLIHVSEVSWGKKTSIDPRKTFSIGQEVDFVVLDIDTEKHRISLSMKRSTENPIIKFAEKHPVGSVIKAPIRNITDFGMFVSIADNMDGMIHESELTWDGNGNELLKQYNKGDEVECKVIAIDPDRERVALGIKQLTEDKRAASSDAKSLSQYKKNMTVTCIVSKVLEDGIEVLVDEKVPGFVKRSHLAYEKSEQKTERFSEGERLDAKILMVERSNNRLSLSIKEFEKDQHAETIKAYGSVDSGASLGNILGVALDAHKSKMEAAAKDEKNKDKESSEVKEKASEKKTNKKDTEE